ncbi:MAG: universal stress protein, partial [Desulfobacterales bacterium]
MERNLLIALDDSRHSRLAAKYAGAFFASDQQVRFDLLNIQPPLSDFLVEEAKRKASARQKLDRLYRENTAHAKKILADVAEALKQSGIAEERIETHPLPYNQGKAKDILDFATRGRFDAIVLGRRGVSGWQDMLFGSVSNNIIQQSQVLPVWMVDGQPSSGKILVPVDGSSHSLRAVDHLAFILAGRQDNELVFFHVQPKL